MQNATWILQLVSRLVDSSHLILQVVSRLDCSHLPALEMGGLASNQPYYKQEVRMIINI